MKDFKVYRFFEEHLNRKPLFVDVVGAETKFQPVFVDDVARAVVSAIDVDRTINKSYNIPGYKAYEFNEIVDITARSLGKKVYKLHVPYGLSVAIFSVYEKFSFIFLLCFFQRINDQTM